MKRGAYFRPFWVSKWSALRMRTEVVSFLTVFLIFFNFFLFSSYGPHCGHLAPSKPISGKLVPDLRGIWIVGGIYRARWKNLDGKLVRQVPLEAILVIFARIRSSGFFIWKLLEIWKMTPLVPFVAASDKPWRKCPGHEALPKRSLQSKLPKPSSSQLLLSQLKPFTLYKSEFLVSLCTRFCSTSYKLKTNLKLSITIG